MPVAADMVSVALNKSAAGAGGAGVLECNMPLILLSCKCQTRSSGCVIAVSRT